MVWVVLQTSSFLLAEDSKAFDKMKCSFFFFIPICYKMLTFLRKLRVTAHYVGRYVLSVVR